MDARGGIEPPIRVLQTPALPLGYPARTSVSFDTEGRGPLLRAAAPSQAADAFAVVDSPTIRTAEREPHFQFSTGRVGVRRPVEMEHALGGDSTMDIVPDLTDIILMLDLGIIVKLVAVLDYLQAFRRHVGLLELIGFHFSHNKKDYRTNFSTSKEHFSSSANFFGLLVGFNSFSQSIIAARRTATGKAGSGLRLAGASPVGKVDI